MADSDPQINISQIKVAGVGGFGLVVIVAAMALDMPVVRAFEVAALVGGFLGAAALFVYRRLVESTPPGPGSIFKLETRRLNENREEAPSGRTRHRSLQVAM